MMTPRITGLDRETATGRVGEIFSESVKQFGTVSNFSKIMALAPGALEAWMTANRGIRMRYLDEDPEFLKVEQAAIIRTSSQNQSEYCLLHNIDLGAEAGLTTEQIELIQADNYEAAECLDERTKATIAWIDAVTNMSASGDEDAFQRMTTHFSDQQIVELTVLCCMWNFSNRFTEAFHIPPEPEGKRLRFRPLPVASAAAE
jgi:alkylhydroperoxidase family enzyme